MAFVKQIGRYRLDAVLGSGAFATVWKGFDPQLDIAVAVTVLADNWAQDADVRERFLAEARLLRRIESRRIVRVHDVGVAEPELGPGHARPFFVMDFVDGGTLADQVGRLEPAEAVRLAGEAAEAVQELHDAGVIHRDIKPSNLLLDRRTGPPRVVVADLGSAKLAAEASGITSPMGTPAYMAPEQADRLGGFDGRADVYALGVVAYELIAGHRPFEDHGAASVLLRGPDERPAPLPVGLGLPVAVDDLLVAALDLDPTRRPADAGVFAGMLRAAAGGAAAERLQRGWRAPRDWPARLVVLVAALAFAIAAGLSWLLA